MIRATYLLDPVDAAPALAELASVGVPWGSSAARAQVVASAPGDGAAGRVTIGFPVEVWGDDLPLLLSTVVAGEVMDRGDVAVCRLIDLEVPDGLLPGPAFAAPDNVLVGAVLAPAAGATPRDLGSVAADMARGGVDVIVDPVPLADPPWCSIEDRVAEVTARIPGDVSYFVNVSGNSGTVMHRATVAVDMGAGGLVIHAGTQGLDAVRLLREADLGVPVFAHRVGFGPWMRSRSFGVAPVVLARLLRLAGADCVMCGAFGGTRADTPEDVIAQVAACREPIGATAVPASVAVLDGGLDPGTAAGQVQRLDGTGLLILLDAAAYQYPGGIEAAVRGTVESLRVFD
jgi:ribulose-bisphosphate carboxylase large chain